MPDYGLTCYIDLSTGTEESPLIANDKRRSSSTSSEHSWKHFFIDSLDKHPIERKFISKLDFFLLSSSMLGYFIKTINQLNISVAYINGMNEYYSMDKNQYNYLLSSWTLGYVLGQIPSSILMTRFSARHYLGLLQVSWGILSVLQIYCTLLSSLYVLRFIVGVAELAYFPGIQFILGSFYSSTEIAKRSTLFGVSSSLAGALSPIIQQIILQYCSAGESGRLQGFQYMFLVDGLITFPIAVYTMLVIPNTPQTMDTFYFCPQDKLIALERKRRYSGSSKGSSTVSIRQYFRTWHIWVFPIVFLAFNNSTACHGQPTFQTWLKYDLGLPSSSYNIIPSIASIVGVVLAILVSLVGDFYGKGKLNYLFISIYFTCTGIGCLLLAWWDIPRLMHWGCYILIILPLSLSQPQIFSWINRLLHRDTAKRNFVVVITNTLAYVTGAWVPIFVWDTRDQPRYFIGFVYTTILCCIGLVFTIIAKNMEERR